MSRTGRGPVSGHLRRGETPPLSTYSGGRGGAKTSSPLFFFFLGKSWWEQNVQSPFYPQSKPFLDTFVSTFPVPFDPNILYPNISHFQDANLLCIRCVKALTLWRHSQMRCDTCREGSHALTLTRGVLCFDGATVESFHTCDSFMNTFGVNGMND